MRRQYAAIDMKSFYASVECVARRLNPLTTRLLVADASRSDQTICLAVSPALKAIGVPSRPRLFEAKQAISVYERMHRTKVSYITAVPRMALYEQVSAQIHGVMLRYAAPEDIHVYSIDESFIDCTPYLHLYMKEAELQKQSPAYVMTMTIIRDVLRTTGITATAGIGTNLYLAKVAMDIVAKKKPADADGVRIASLDENSYMLNLWEHQPLTDFWMLGPGKVRTLHKAFLWTMGDIAAKAQSDEEWFYRKFGVDGEILIDHAFGIEPVTMKDIKNYKPEGHSLSHGQVLPRPYQYAEARNAVREMIEALCSDLLARGLQATAVTWWVSYDWKSLEEVSDYDGPVLPDFYGRLHPKPSNGSVRLRLKTNSPVLIADAILFSFDQKTDHRLLYRRLGVCAAEVSPDSCAVQMDMFTEYKTLDRDRKLRSALLEVRGRFGLNAVFNANSLLDGANQLERNMQIGGHRA